MKTRLPERLRVASKWITSVFVGLSLFLIIGLQGHSGGETTLFRFHVASTLLAVVTYPLILYGLSRRYRPKLPLLLSVVLTAAYPATFMLLGAPFKPEALVVPLLIIIPPVLYLSGWFIGRSQPAD